MSEEATNNIQEVNQEVDLAPEANEQAGVLTFDELDQLTDGRSEETLLSENKKESEAKEDKPEAKAEDTDEEAEKGPEKEEGEAEAFEEEIKKLLARQGDEEMELAANLLFKHKVDGEEVDVELQELLNNYSGKISYDRKFQEFSSSKKEFEQYKQGYDKDIEQINGYINKFAEKIKSNDAMGALQYFAEFSGMKPHEFKRELLNQLAPEVFRLNEMSPEQIQAEDLKAQNDYLLQKQESDQKRSQEEQSLIELQKEIANVQEAHSISDEDFENAYQELLDGEFEGSLTPAIVADYYVNSQAFSKAETALTQVDPMLAQQDNILETLQKIVMENPSFDNEDLVEIVQDVYGDIKKTASKSVSKKAEPKKQEKKAPTSKEDYLDWEDL